MRLRVEAITVAQSAVPGTPGTASAVNAATRDRVYHVRNYSQSAYVLVSVYDASDSNGNPVGPDQSWILTPGQFESFDIVPGGYIGVATYDPTGGTNTVGFALLSLVDEA